nr:hypothetical protein [Tanacetum cinerariifolium]
MLVHQGEGSGTPTEPHHTPSPKAQQSSPNAPSPSLPPTITKTIPIVIPTAIPTLEQYSRSARIAQSSALPTAADEPASPFEDDSQGEAFPTVSGLEGSMQHKLHELTNLCTHLQRQQTEMVSKIAAQDLKITSLKAMIKILEDKDGGGAEPSGEDATIKGRSLETGEEAGVEESTERGSNDTEELVNVLTFLDAASILTSGVQVIEEFVLMASKEERERFKRKGLRLEQESPKKMKTSKEVSQEDLKEMMQLVPVEEVYVKGIQVKHPIIIWEIYSEGQRNYWKIIREDLNQLWNLEKETLSIRQDTSDKENELWVELKRLYEPDVEDQLWTHTSPNT